MSDTETTLEAFPDPVCTVDTDGVVDGANESLLAIEGWSRSDLVGESYPAVERVFDAGSDRERVRATARSSPGGRPEWTAAVVTGRPDGGAADGAMVTLREPAARESSEAGPGRFCRIVERTSDIATVIDETGTITYVSPSVRTVLGYEPAELEGKSGFGFQPPEMREQVEAAIERALSAPEETQVVQTQFERADGSLCWVESTIQNCLEDPVIDGLLVNSREISERKRREREAKRAETLFRNSRDALFIINVCQGEAETEFRIDRVNPAYEAMTGLAHDRLQGKTVREAFGDAEGGAIRERYTTCVEQREPQQYEERLSVPEPNSHWETRIAPVVVDDEVVQLVGATRDVTENRRRRQALERYERLVESLPVGIFQLTVGSEGGLGLVNDAMLDLLDADARADLAGQEVGEILGDDWTDVRADLEDRGELRAREVRLETVEGTSLWAELTAVRREVDGRTVVDGALQDVSERKAYEQQLQTQRDNLDLLNEVISHDIRNDLQVVVAAADVLADRVDETNRGHVETVRNSAEQATELTRTARDIADILLSGDDGTDEVSLRASLVPELDELRSTHPEAAVVVDGDVPGVAVHADDMLDSVFRNLLKNAVQHSDAETPTVTVSVETTAETVRVEVADNGPGVPPERRAEVFGRGEKGLDSEGTGVGLYLVDTLVTTYGGDVRVTDAGADADADTTADGAAFVVELERAGSP